MKWTIQLFRAYTLSVALTSVRQSRLRQRLGSTPSKASARQTSKKLRSDAEQAKSGAGDPSTNTDAPLTLPEAARADGAGPETLPSSEPWRNTP